MRQFAKELRTNLTEAERLLWRHLRSRRLEDYKFRRQQIIGLYIVDFVCFEAKLIVELDGGQHAESVAYDHSRTAFLTTAGFRVMRFWNNEVLGNLESVLACIRAECAVAPSPQPSPSEGRGGFSATPAITDSRSIPQKQVPSPIKGEGVSVRFAKRTTVSQTTTSPLPLRRGQGEG
jgi:very-short-patch-repair endonuclease